MTTKEELDIFYKYYLHMKSGNAKHGIDGFNMRFFDGWFNPNDTFYAFMCDFRGFNGFPKIISDDEFYDLDELVFYHGFKSFEHGAELIANHIYNYGTGVSSPGLYFSTNIQTAKSYTNYDFQAKDSDKILKTKCLGKCMPNRTRETLNFMYTKRLNFEKYIENEEDKAKIIELQKFCETLPEEDKIKFYNLFRESISTVCAYLGYDYMTDGYENVIVSNRGALVIPESNAKKFLKNSNSYKEEWGKSVILSNMEEVYRGK